MTDATILFLPGQGAGDYRWWRTDGARVTARGQGLPEAAEGETIAVAPAEAVTLHWAELPDRSPAQAVAAARLLVAEASAAPIAELHVAVGAGGGGERAIGVVSASQMQGWLDGLRAIGLDPDRLVPAAMLLPRPDEGFVAADVAGAPVVRGTTTAFAAEAELAALLTAGCPTETLDAPALEAAAAAALAAPGLDLRQGAFARRRRIGIDWPLVRRLGWLALAILTVSLAIDVVRLVRYDLAASALEARAEAMARSGLPRGEAINDADRQLGDRLSGLRGPGQGFTRTAAIAFAAVRSIPGTELSGLAFDADGSLRLSVGAQTQGQVVALRDRLIAAGFDVAPSTFTEANGHLSGDLRMRRP